VRSAQPARWPGSHPRRVAARRDRGRRVRRRDPPRRL